MKLNIYLVFLMIVSWGLWGFFGKIASERIGHQVLLWNGVSSYVLLISYLFISRQAIPIKGDKLSIAFAILSGLFIAVGSIAYYFLLKQNTAGKTAALAALYPVVTMILSALFLGEKITLVKSTGIGLAVIALYLLSI